MIDKKQLVADISRLTAISMNLATGGTPATWNSSRVRVYPVESVDKMSGVLNEIAGRLIDIFDSDKEAT